MSKVQPIYTELLCESCMGSGSVKRTICGKCQKMKPVGMNEDGTKYICFECWGNDLSPEELEATI